MDINFELYKVFYYVAKNHSFSQASRDLFISQSAVSQSIRSLEKKMDTALFVRSTRSVRLTPAGETLFRYIEPAVNLILRGQAQTADTHSMKAGQLRIGASDTICRYYLVPYIQAFHEHFPLVHIKVTNGTSEQCAGFLENGQVDLIVSNYPNPRLDSWAEIRFLKEFQDIFAASQAFGHLRGRTLSLHDLLGSPILMLDKNSTTSKFLHRICQQRQLDLVPEAELSSNDLLLDLARIGLGIAFVPDYCLPENDPDLFRLDIQEEIPRRSLAACWSEKMPLSEAGKYFLDSLTGSQI